MSHTHSPRTITFKIVLTVDFKLKMKINQIKHLSWKFKYKSNLGKRMMKQISVSDLVSEVSQQLKDIKV